MALPHIRPFERCEDLQRLERALVTHDRGNGQQLQQGSRLSDAPSCVVVAADNGLFPCPCCNERHADLVQYRAHVLRCRVEHGVDPLLPLHVIKRVVATVPDKEFSRILRPILGAPQRIEIFAGKRAPQLPQTPRMATRRGDGSSRSTDNAEMDARPRSVDRGPSHHNLPTAGCSPAVVQDIRYFMSLPTAQRTTLVLSNVAINSKDAALFAHVVGYSDCDVHTIDLSGTSFPDLHTQHLVVKSIFRNKHVTQVVGTESKIESRLVSDDMAQHLRANAQRRAVTALQKEVNLAMKWITERDQWFAKEATRLVWDHLVGARHMHDYEHDERTDIRRQASNALGLIKWRARSREHVQLLESQRVSLMTEESHHRDSLDTRFLRGVLDACAMQEDEQRRWINQARDTQRQQVKSSERHAIFAAKDEERRRAEECRLDRRRCETNEQQGRLNVRHHERDELAILRRMVERSVAYIQWNEDQVVERQTFADVERSTRVGYVKEAENFFKSQYEKTLAAIKSIQTRQAGQRENLLRDSVSIRTFYETTMERVLAHIEKVEALERRLTSIKSKGRVREDARMAALRVPPVVAFVEKSRRHDDDAPAQLVSPSHPFAVPMYGAPSRRNEEIPDYAPFQDALVHVGMSKHWVAEMTSAESKARGTFQEERAVMNEYLQYISKAGIVFLRNIGTLNSKWALHAHELSLAQHSTALEDALKNATPQELAAMTAEREVVLSRFRGCWADPMPVDAIRIEKETVRRGQLDLILDGDCDAESLRTDQTNAYAGIIDGSMFDPRLMSETSLAIMSSVAMFVAGSDVVSPKLVVGFDTDRSDAIMNEDRTGSPTNATTKHRAPWAHRRISIVFQPNDDAKHVAAEDIRDCVTAVMYRFCQPISHAVMRRVNVQLSLTFETATSFGEVMAEKHGYAPWCPAAQPAITSTVAIERTFWIAVVPSIFVLPTEASTRTFVEQQTEEFTLIGTSQLAELRLPSRVVPVEDVSATTPCEVQQLLPPSQPPTTAASPAAEKTEGGWTNPYYDAIVRIWVSDATPGQDRISIKEDLIVSLDIAERRTYQVRNVIINSTTLAAVVSGTLQSTHHVAKNPKRPSAADIMATSMHVDRGVTLRIVAPHATSGMLHALLSHLYYHNFAEGLEESTRTVHVQITTAYGETQHFQSTFNVEPVDKPTELRVAHPRLVWRHQPTAVTVAAKKFAALNVCPVATTATLFDEDTDRFSSGFMRMSISNPSKGDSIALCLPYPAGFCHPRDVPHPLSLGDDGISIYFESRIVATRVKGLILRHGEIQGMPSRQESVGLANDNNNTSGATATGASPFDDGDGIAASPTAGQLNRTSGGGGPPNARSPSPDTGEEVMFSFAGDDDCSIAAAQSLLQHVALVTNLGATQLTRQHPNGAPRDIVIEMQIGEGEQASKINDVINVRPGAPMLQLSEKNANVDYKEGAAAVRLPGLDVSTSVDRSVTTTFNGGWLHVGFADGFEDGDCVFLRSDDPDFRLQDERKAGKRGQTRGREPSSVASAVFVQDSAASASGAQFSAHPPPLSEASKSSFRRPLVQSSSQASLLSTAQSAAINGLAASGVFNTVANQPQGPKEIVFAGNKDATAMMSPSIRTDGGFLVQFAPESAKNPTGTQVLRKHVSSLLRAMCYVNQGGEKPTVETKIIRVALCDAMSNTPSFAYYAVTLTLVADVTEVRLLQPRRRYVQQARPVPLLPFGEAAFRDPDTEFFDGGYIAVQCVAGMQKGDTYSLVLPSAQGALPPAVEGYTTKWFGERLILSDDRRSVVLIRGTGSMSRRTSILLGPTAPINFDLNGSDNTGGGGLPQLAASRGATPPTGATKAGATPTPPADRGIGGATPTQTAPNHATHVVVAHVSVVEREPGTQTEIKLSFPQTTTPTVSTEMASYLLNGICFSNLQEQKKESQRQLMVRIRDPANAQEGKNKMTLDVAPTVAGFALPSGLAFTTKCVVVDDEAISSSPPPSSSPATQNLLSIEPPPIGRQSSSVSTPSGSASRNAVEMTTSGVPAWVTFYLARSVALWSDRVVSFTAQLVSPDRRASMSVKKSSITGRSAESLRAADAELSADHTAAGVAEGIELFIASKDVTVRADGTVWKDGKEAIGSVAWDAEGRSLSWSWSPPSTNARAPPAAAAPRAILLTVLRSLACRCFLPAASSQSTIIRKRGGGATTSSNAASPPPGNTAPSPHDGGLQLAGRPPLAQSPSPTPLPSVAIGGTRPLGRVVLTLKELDSATPTTLFVEIEIPLSNQFVSNSK